MSFKRPAFFLIFAASACFADMNLYPNKEPKISVQNTILAKVNGNTISVIDVMKKMDMLLHQNYPQFADSVQARYQFYAASWRPILMEMIDTELMLADSAEKEMKLTDGEIREEMESRFGPNITLTLEKIGISYPDAWRMIKSELIVRRMMWFFVQSKAMQGVSPGAIREAYQHYVAENPPSQEWRYHVISLRGAGEERAQEVFHILQEAKDKDPEQILKQWTAPDVTAQVSSEFSAKESELSESHKLALSALLPGQYSQPSLQQSKNGTSLYRIFYLVDKKDQLPATFESMAAQLKNDLMQQRMTKESTVYLQKLRKHYGFDPTHLKETVPDDLNPFHLE